MFTREGTGDLQPGHLISQDWFLILYTCDDTVLHKLRENVGNHVIHQENIDILCCGLSLITADS